MNLSARWLAGRLAAGKKAGSWKSESGSDPASCGLCLMFPFPQRWALYTRAFSRGFRHLFPLPSAAATTTVKNNGTKMA